MEIRTDQRTIQGERDPAAEKRLTAQVPALRDLQFAMARDLAGVDACGHFVFCGCASAVEFGMRMGLSASEARTLLNLGKALRSAPQLEDLVRSGEVQFEAASALGRVLGDARLLRPDDDWVGHARTHTLRSLRRRINRRLEEHSQQQMGIVEITVHVREKVKDDFDRARVVASRKARKTLTEGQVFGRVVDTYLEVHDPLRRKPAARRAGPTASKPESRYVPAEVERAVRRRAGDQCEVPGCSNRIHLQLAHRTPHVAGSGREADDLLLLCSAHHTLYDAGLLRLVPSDSGEIRFEIATNGAETVPRERARGPPRDPAGNGSPDRVAGDQIAERRTILRPSARWIRSA